MSIAYEAFGRFPGIFEVSFNAHVALILQLKTNPTAYSLSVLFIVVVYRFDNIQLFGAI